MLEEDIESQQSLLSPNTQNNNPVICRIQRIKNMKKCNKQTLCDLIIGLVLLVCVIATIVIIVCNKAN